MKKYSKITRSNQVVLSGDGIASRVARRIYISDFHVITSDGSSTRVIMFNVLKITSILSYLLFFFILLIQYFLSLFQTSRITIKPQLTMQHTFDARYVQRKRKVSSLMLNRTMMYYQNRKKIVAHRWMGIFLNF